MSVELGRPVSDQLTTIPFLMSGVWTTGQHHRTVLDKFHLHPCATLSLPSRDQVHEAVLAAQTAFRSSRLTAYERGAILGRTADRIEQLGPD